MKSLWNRHLFAGLILIFVSFAFVVHEFTKPKVKSASALSVVSGQIVSYSFEDGSRGRHHYVIRLLEYPAVFQIPADFVGCFSKDAFQSDLKRGDLIWVSIPKENEGDLASGKRLFVFSARTKAIIYLDEQSTLKIYNSNFPLVISLAFFLIGSALITWRLMKA